MPVCKSSHASTKAATYHHTFCTNAILCYCSPTTWAFVPMTFLFHNIRPKTKLIMFATVIALRATQIIGIGVGERKRVPLLKALCDNDKSISLVIICLCSRLFGPLNAHSFFLIIIISSRTFSILRLDRRRPPNLRHSWYTCAIGV